LKKGANGLRPVSKRAVAKFGLQLVASSEELFVIEKGCSKIATQICQLTGQTALMVAVLSEATCASLGQLIREKYHKKMGF
jgi:hypothetical protein